MEVAGKSRPLYFDRFAFRSLVWCSIFLADNLQPQSDSDDDSVVAESIGGDSVPHDSDPGIETLAPDSPFGSLSYDPQARSTQSAITSISGGEIWYQGI